MDVIILAGGDPEQLMDGKIKPLATFDGVPSVRRVADAHLDSSLENIVVIGHPDVEAALPTSPRLHFVPDDGPFSEKFEHAFRTLPGASKSEKAVMLSFADIPLLRASTLDMLVHIFSMKPAETAFFLPVVPEEYVRPFEPAYARALHHLSALSCKEGNVVIVRPNLIHRREELFRDFFDHRDYTNHPDSAFRTLWKYGGAFGIGLGALMAMNYRAQRPVAGRLLQKSYVERLGSRIIGERETGGRFAFSPVPAPDLFLEFDLHPNFGTDELDEYQMLSQNFPRFDRIIDELSAQRPTLEVRENLLSPSRKFLLLNRWTLSYLASGAGAIWAGTYLPDPAIPAQLAAGFFSVSTGALLSSVGIGYFGKHRQRFDELNARLSETARDGRITEYELLEVMAPHLQHAPPCPRSTVRAVLEDRFENGSELWYGTMKCQFRPVLQYAGGLFDFFVRKKAYCK